MDEHLERWGVHPGYHDMFGHWHATSSETRAALLSAMGVEADQPPPDSPLAILVLWPGETRSLSGAAELTLEDGTVFRPGGQLSPDLPIGYHRLRDETNGAQTLIIKRPAACHFDPAMRIWGLAVQLYAARSTQSWGLGDLADLRRLAQWSSSLGAGAVLVNPLSAAAPIFPQQASPYYPTSRRFRNPLYLCVHEVPGADRSDGQLAALAADARTLNQSRRIDRDRVLGLKMQALESIWRAGANDADFETYQQQQGEDLRIFGTYCALAEVHGGDWRVWPTELRDPHSGAVQQFAAARADRVGFHAWLQWLLDRQLADAARYLPLVQDLPIGVDPGGADAWQWQDVLATGATVGAPPDLFNADGQNWCLPPFIPHRLRAVGFRPFIQTIRAAMRHAGGLRIDHVMGLFRLFWIPESSSPGTGTYVRYPADEMLAVVAVESHRAGAWVAGEDLGTVEPLVRHRLQENRMLSYRLMWFEDGPPRDYPPLSMAAITTHDLPTVAGLWSGADFAAQQQIGLRPSREGYEELRRRLQHATGLNDGEPPEVAVRRAYQAMASAPSAVLVANLEDAAAVEERPNMPGTIDQWPNWSIALPQPLEQIEAADLPRAIAQALDRGP
ncbi:MAG: 4-alpha-glucanotransferase [Pirellulaceae bacterium]|nr:4-alpha-glucanotransferase [Pirellulaceae bacterium]